MIDFSYLEKGLTGMSTAHRAGGMAGHLGAAVLAGYFFGEQNPDVDPGVLWGIERDLERIMAGEEDVWFRPQKAGVTVAELFATRDEATEDALAGASPDAVVADALSKSSDQLRQSGHNVIFGSIAIRALQDHPEFGTPGAVSGMVKLMQTFVNVGEGKGYFGKGAGWKQGATVSLDSIDEVRCDSVADAAELAIHELIETAAWRRQGFGGLFHLIDHAAAIVELSECGFPELAKQSMKGYVRHVRLLRALPILEEELGGLQRSEEDPLAATYWKRRNSSQYSAWLTHRIKVLYGLGVLLPVIDDPEKEEKAKAAFRYLMA
ncbi:MAG: hypothetical protein P1U87_18515, partial [Verrucomicrobiales bacterium]|nr:hypothetical protein [Verrucomicrobiales bacterium]